MNQNKILNTFASSTKGIKDNREAFGIFSRDMHNIHAKFLGRGWYSSVWEIDGLVYKINSGQQGERDGFIRWIHATRHLVGINQHIPWVGGIATDGDRYCIELEPLQPIGDYQARLLGADRTCQLKQIHLARYAEQNPALANVIEFAHDLSKAVWSEMDYEPSPSMTTKIGELDFCDGSFSNLMHRNGVIVVNDPLSYSQEKIGVYARELENGLMQCAA